MLNVRVRIVVRRGMNTISRIPRRLNNRRSRCGVEITRTRVRFHLARFRIEHFVVAVFKSLCSGFETTYSGDELGRDVVDGKGVAQSKMVIYTSEAKARALGVMQSLYYCGSVWDLCAVWWCGWSE